jgi:hypothetical protein
MRDVADLLGGFAPELIGSGSPAGLLFSPIEGCPSHIGHSTLEIEATW